MVGPALTIRFGHLLNNPTIVDMQIASSVISLGLSFIYFVSLMFGSCLVLLLRGDSDGSLRCGLIFGDDVSLSRKVDQNRKGLRLSRGILSMSRFIMLWSQMFRFFIAFLSVKLNLMFNICIR